MNRPQSPFPSPCATQSEEKEAEESEMKE